MVVVLLLWLLFCCCGCCFVVVDVLLLYFGGCCCSDVISYFHIQSVIAIMSLVLSSLTVFFVFNSFVVAPSEVLWLTFVCRLDCQVKLLLAFYFSASLLNFATTTSTGAVYY